MLADFGVHRFDAIMIHRISSSVGEDALCGFFFGSTAANLQDYKRRMKQGLMSCVTLQNLMLCPCSQTDHVLLRLRWIFWLDDK